MRNRKIDQLDTTRRILLSIFATVAIVGPVFHGASAQTPQAELRFEVSTVKPAGAARGGFIQMPSNGMFTVRGMSLKDLFLFAYGIQRDFVKGGPKWLESEGWEVVAKPAAGVIPSTEQRKEMLKSLLAERFKLTFHIESKESTYYALTIAKGGVKMKRRTPGDGGDPFSLVFRGPSLPGRDAPMARVAEVFQLSLFDQPVIDRTGLDGTWDFNLVWAPDESQFGGRYRDVNPNPDAPSFNTALQEQLGLKMEKQKGLVETFVIDHVERPSEN
jgi:uncharacterized protein (TIGR03435 family)